jgi:hypothetical protein
MRGSVHRHRHRVSCLYENGAWPVELAHKTFTSSQVADNAARRNTLQRVFAIPGDKVSIVNNVLLAFAELRIIPELVMC